MFTLISPAKKLDFEEISSDLELTAPELFSETKILSEVTQKLKVEDLQVLMKLSENLAQLNYERFQSFDTTSNRPVGSKHAVLAFAGDTYTGLRAHDFSRDELAFAQDHLGILSGLYGVLRPLDAILPYRLEMGTKLSTPRGKSLYEFWGNRVVTRVQEHLDELDSNIVVNLASNEYFSVMKATAPNIQVVTPVFKEIRNGVAKIISFNAKRARGTMARFIIEGRLTQPEELKTFTLDGYRYMRRESTENEWLFLRAQPEPS